MTGAIHEKVGSDEKGRDTAPHGSPPANSSTTKAKAGQPGATRDATNLPTPTANAPPTMLTIGNAPAAEGASIVNNDPAGVAAAVDERRPAATGDTPANVIIAAADADYRWALPAGAYHRRAKMEHDGMVMWQRPL